MLETEDNMTAKKEASAPEEQAQTAPAAPVMTEIPSTFKSGASSSLSIPARSVI